MRVNGVLLIKYTRTTGANWIVTGKLKTRVTLIILR